MGEKPPKTIYYYSLDFRDILHQSSIGIREDGSRFTCRLSATTEAVLSINLMECLMRKLEITNMIPAFIGKRIILNLVVDIIHSNELAYFDDYRR